MNATLTRDTLREFLSRHAAPGADFPTGARMQAAGAAHGEADILDCGYDYTHDCVAHSIAEWVTLRDARAYLAGYRQGRAHADALTAIIRAANAADTLRTARAGTTWDGGDETAPTWARYVAALAEYDAATAALHAAAADTLRTTGEDADDCAYCSGNGSQHCTHLPAVDTDCPDCGGDGIIPATGRGAYILCGTCRDSGAEW